MVFPDRDPAAPDCLQTSEDSGYPHRWIALASLAFGGVGLVAGSVWLAASRPAAGGSRPGLTLALIGLGVIGLCLGLGYFVLSPGFRGLLAARRGFGSHRLVLGCTLLVVLLGNLGPLALSGLNPGEGICSVSGFLSAALSVDIALVAVFYLRFARPGVITTADLGLGWARLPRLLAAGLLLGVLALVVTAAIQLALNGLGVRQTQLRDFGCVKQFPLSGFLMVVLAGGIVAPIAEELFFRGFVFRSYLLARGPLVAYPASALVFAALHVNVPALLPIMALGVMFAWALQRSGSVVPSMVAHAFNNSFAFAILYFTDLSP